jgi:hypothetical protein
MIVRILNPTSGWVWMNAAMVFAVRLDLRHADPPVPARKIDQITALVMSPAKIRRNRMGIPDQNRTPSAAISENDRCVATKRIEMADEAYALYGHMLGDVESKADWESAPGSIDVKRNFGTKRGVDTVVGTFFVVFKRDTAKPWFCFANVAEAFMPTKKPGFRE